MGDYLDYQDNTKVYGNMGEASSPFLSKLLVKSRLQTLNPLRLESKLSKPNYHLLKDTLLLVDRITNLETKLSSIDSKLNILLSALKLILIMETLLLLQIIPFRFYTTSTSCFYIYTFSNTKIALTLTLFCV